MLRLILAAQALCHRGFNKKTALSQKEGSYFFISQRLMIGYPQRNPVLPQLPLDPLSEQRLAE